jgi:hypothetical protein
MWIIYFFLKKSLLSRRNDGSPEGHWILWEGELLDAGASHQMSARGNNVFL